MMLIYLFLLWVFCIVAVLVTLCNAILSDEQSDIVKLNRDITMAELMNILLAGGYIVRGTVNVGISSSIIYNCITSILKNSQYKYYYIASIVFSTLFTFYIIAQVAPVEAIKIIVLLLIPQELIDFYYNYKPYIKIIYYVFIMICIFTVYEWIYSTTYGQFVIDSFWSSTQTLMEGITNLLYNAVDAILPTVTDIAEDDEAQQLSAAVINSLSFRARHSLSKCCNALTQNTKTFITTSCTNIGSFFKKIGEKINYWRNLPRIKWLQRNYIKQTRINRRKSNATQ